MRELFFFKRKVLDRAPVPEGIDAEEWHSFLKSAESEMPEEDRPCFLDAATSAPDEELNRFVSERLITPRRASPRTWSSYAHGLSIMLRHLESQGIDWKHASQAHLNRFFWVRTSGKHQNVPAIAESSWNVTATAIVHLYEWAKDDRLIHTVPFSYRAGWGGFGAPPKDVADIFAKNPENAVRFIPIDNYKNIWRPTILAGRNSLRNISLIDLLVAAGLRITEALNLNKGDLPDIRLPKWKNRKTVPLTVTGKGKKTRTVRVPKHIVRAIWFYIESSEYRPQEESNNDSPVFLSTHGNRLSPRSVQLLFQRISDATGIKLVPHGCRHTFAVYQLAGLIRKLAIHLKQIKEEGVSAYKLLLTDPLRQLQKQMGHSSILSTYIYLDCLEEAEELVEESLESWVTWKS
ncbi:tyrosine-type recombinase/integrase [Roseateles sp. 22389]|uniref:tyrosine-type recombinase/integrase n=1 Tax=Roseateles sp. 22389 TaxID=3453916 RepID=UPI003F84550A